MGVVLLSVHHCVPRYQTVIHIFKWRGVEASGRPNLVQRELEKTGRSNINEGGLGQ